MYDLKNEKINIFTVSGNQDCIVKKYSAVSKDPSFVHFAKRNSVNEWVFWCKYILTVN